tara:strand:+ start:3751 stop:5280 length:1530 start_codon:yes stop_codon:yes gene_type:complete
MNFNLIFKNTLVMYLRMFVTSVVGLYTSRVVLQTLGVEDFGIYSVVSGLVLMMAFLNSAMSATMQRFFSIAIDEFFEGGLKRSFSISMSVTIIISLVVLILMLTVGVWFFYSVLSIPDSKLDQAFVAYLISCLSVVLMIFQTPFNAVMVAKERLDIVAGVGILESFLKLALAFVLGYMEGDYLIFYSSLIAFVSATSLVLYFFIFMRLIGEEGGALFLTKNFNDCREVASLMSWNLLGNFSYMFKLHGGNILLNAFFGVGVNAAYAVMLQVQTIVGLFVNGFLQAINPQIYKKYSAGDSKSVMYLLQVGSRVGFYLLFLLILPVIFTLNVWLNIWLVEVPKFTKEFISLMLIGMCIDVISMPLMTGLMATGNIKKYQILVSGLLFFNIPITYFSFVYFGDPMLFFYISFVISLLALWLRLFFVEKMVGIPLLSFFGNTLFPIVQVVAVSFTISYFFVSDEENGTGFLRGLIEMMIVFAVTLFTIIIFGISPKERTFIIDFLKTKVTHEK